MPPSPSPPPTPPPPLRRPRRLSPPRRLPHFGPAELLAAAMLLQQAAVPTADAQILPGRTLHPGHLTVFEHVGDMIPDLSYLHVAIPISLKEYDDMFELAKNVMMKDTRLTMSSKNYRNEIWYHPKKDSQHNMYISPHNGENGTGSLLNISVHHYIRILHDEFQNLVAALPTKESVMPPSLKKAPSPGQSVLVNTSRRQKRGFWMGALAGATMSSGALATFLGVFSQGQIKALSKQDTEVLVEDGQKKNEVLAAMDLRMNKIVDLLHEHSQDDILAQRYIAWMTIIRELQQRLTSFRNLLAGLYQHRLHPSWFEGDQLQKLHQDVMNFGKTKNVDPLSEHLSDYYQMDTSFVSSEGELVIILHVPATRHRENWNIFRYHPFPIENHKGFVTMITVPDQLIALGPNHQHKVLSETDLHHCLRKNHVYLCSSPATTMTDLGASCIGALMGQVPEGITSLCNLKMEPEREMVMQAGAQDFAVYSPVPFTAHGTCLNGTLITQLISKVSVIHVDPGCSLNLRHHKVESPFSITMPRRPLITHTSWDTLEVPKQLLQKADQAEQRMYNFLAEDKNLSDSAEAGIRVSQAQLARLHQRLVSEVQNTYSQGFWIALSVFIILGLVWCVVMYIWCSRYFCPKPLPLVAPSVPTLYRYEEPQPPHVEFVVGTPRPSSPSTPSPMDTD